MSRLNLLPFPTVVRCSNRWRIFAYFFNFQETLPKSIKSINLTLPIDLVTLPGLNEDAAASVYMNMYWLNGKEQSNKSKLFIIDTSVTWPLPLVLASSLLSSLYQRRYSVVIVYKKILLHKVIIHITSHHLCWTWVVFIKLYLEIY